MVITKRKTSIKRTAKQKQTTKKWQPNKKSSKNRNKVTIFGLSRWVFITIMAIIVLVFLYEPCRNLYCAKRNESILLQEKEETEAANNVAQERVNQLSTEEGIKDEARLHGYVEQGETPVTVEGLESDETLETSNPAPSNIRDEVLAKQDPFYISLGDFIFGYNKQNAP